MSKIEIGYYILPWRWGQYYPHKR